MSWFVLLLCSLMLSPVAAAAHAGQVDVGVSLSGMSNDCHDKGTGAGDNAATSEHGDCLVSPAHCLTAAILRPPAVAANAGGSVGGSMSPDLVTHLRGDVPGAEPPPPRT